MKKILILFLLFTCISFAGDFPIRAGAYSYGLTYLEITKYKESGEYKIAIEGQIEYIPTDSCAKGCAYVDILDAVNPEKGILYGKTEYGQKFKLVFVDKDVIKVYIDSRKPYLLRPYKD